MVVRTGSATAFGKIAVGLTERQAETTFQSGLRDFSTLLVKVAAVLTSTPRKRTPHERPRRTTNGSSTAFAIVPTTSPATTAPETADDGRPTTDRSRSPATATLSVAASLLANHGHRDVVNVTGGMTAWNNAGYPVEQ